MGIEVVADHNEVNLSVVHTYTQTVVMSSEAICTPFASSIISDLFQDVSSLSLSAFLKLTCVCVCVSIAIQSNCLGLL